MLGSDPKILRFDRFTIDLARCVVIEGGEELALRRQSFDVLRYLAERRGQVVSRKELVKAVWGAAEPARPDDSVFQCIKEIRRALGDDVRWIIRAVPGRGYEFMADVTGGETAPAALPASAAPTRSDNPSIAVLPFDNMSGNPDQNYFADGLVEEITTKLSRFRWLFVIARNSSFTYKGRAVDVKQVGREMGVRYVLEGSVRKAGDRVRIAAQLVSTETGAHLWADRYDRKFSDVFDIEDEVTNHIVRALVPELTAAEIARARQEHPKSLSAWDRYLRALPLMRQHNKEAWADAVELLRDAVGLDAGFAAAYARLSACLVQAAYFGWRGRASACAADALELARKATIIDDEEPLAYDALASAHQFLGDNAAAEVAARKALQLSPATTAAYGTLITALAFLGRAEEALAAYALSERVSPRDPDRSGRLMGLANAYFVAERYDDAIAAVKQFIALRPNWYGGYTNLAASLALTGRIEEAREAGKRLLELIPRFCLSRARRRPMYVRDRDAKRLFEGLRLAGIPEQPCK
jgi:adenylate cyclase